MITAIWWSYIPHFLSTPGYVYSYAFGELLVLALYGIYQQEGESFVEKYLQLLAAGGSQSPYDLLQPFEIDLNSPEFWQTGLKVIEEMLSQRLSNQRVYSSSFLLRRQWGCVIPSLLIL